MPFTFNMFYFCDPDGHSDYVQNQSFHPVDDKTPTIGTIRAENITCTGADACMLVAYGLPERYIENIRTCWIMIASMSQSTETIKSSTWTERSLYRGAAERLPRR